MSGNYVQDDIDRYFTYNIHMPTKTMYLGSVEYDSDDGETGTDHGMAEMAVKGLHILDRVKPDRPITIIMNNPGGDEYHGMAIFDAIKACQSEVHIKVFGHAMSMGSIILQAADWRVMSPNSRMMLHYGTWGHNDHTLNSYRWAEEGKKFDKWMENLYLKKIHTKHPKYTRKKLQTEIAFDKFLTAEEAVEMGLADEVLDD